MFSRAVARDEEEEEKAERGGAGSQKGGAQSCLLLRLHTYPAGGNG